MIDLVVNVNIDTQYIVINSNCNTLANSHVYKAPMYSRYMQDILYTFTQRTTITNNNIYDVSLFLQFLSQLFNAIAFESKWLCLNGIIFHFAVIVQKDLWGMSWLRSFSPEVNHRLPQR